jgi:pseudaminic acid synthase
LTRIIEINNRRIGPGLPAYIVAEISANHNQDFDQARELVRTAKAVGADAVKLQTYTPDSITIRSDKEYFRIKGGTLWDHRLLYDLYGEAFTPWEWQPLLKDLATELGLDLFSTPFDHTAVDFLEKMNVPAYKIASFEVIDIPLIERVAATKKPIIISTGMATLAEIDDAVRAARTSGGRDLVLLKCTSAYPAPPEAMNLRTIPHLAEAFDVVAGLSDHTLGTTVPVVALALGACVIEKHFTLSRDIPGPDSAFSLEPHEFKAMVEAVRIAEKALGRIAYEFGQSEAASRTFRRSLFVVRDVEAGEVLTADVVRSIRPGHGLPPKSLPDVLGRRARVAIERGTPLSWDLIGQ